MSVALKKQAYQSAEAQDKQWENANAEAVEYDDGLLAVAGPIMVACYGLLFLIATVTFFGSGPALFAVIISTLFGVIFFAIPAIFLKMRSAHDQRWRKDAEHTQSPVVETWTGPIHRWEAIVQIISIPVAVLMGFSLLAIRWFLL